MLIVMTRMIMQIIIFKKMFLVNDCDDINNDDVLALMNDNYNSYKIKTPIKPVKQKSTSETNMLMQKTFQLG
ncbi:hypothetical protein I4U23_030468 [Adineta vaga]|nr:hypothetical protein I4U23_030468 [Adineta vaga]